MKQLLLVFCVCSIAISSLRAQDKPSNLPSIGAGVGMYSYFGELQKGYDVGTLSHIRPGYFLNVEQRIGNFIGIAGNAMMAKLSYNERSPLRNLNFETQINQFDLNLVFHFDNDKIINRTSLFTPFLSVGAGLLMFRPRSDLRDANGELYNYWSDGSIRNLPETDTSSAASTEISRDYTYETELEGEYKKTSLAIPLAAGLTFKMARAIDVRLTGTYCLTGTDFIDHLKDDGKKDKYVGISLAAFVNIARRDNNKRKQDAAFKEVNFAEIDATDIDNDGVKDLYDECPNTPKGITVDAHGCPFDDDHDGVPNHLDKEPNSTKGAVVDASGITITDAMIAERARIKDSLATERKDIFNQNPSLQTMQQIDQERQAKAVKSTLPPEFAAADLNKDNYISAEEIGKTIDMFFEGLTDFTAERINKLIDFFFEQ